MSEAVVACVRRRVPIAARYALFLGTALSPILAAASSQAAPLATISAPSIRPTPRLTLAPPRLFGASLAAEPAIAAEVRPLDLTVRQDRLRSVRLAADDVVINDGDVATSGDNQPGVATISTGSTTISAGNITTDGVYSPGITATGTGPITINVGNVTTSGDYSPGIYAASSGGAVSVKAGSVSTSGVFSDGIRASGTNVAVTVDDVNTRGYNSNGVSVSGYGPNASVDVTINGAIQTYDARANGVYARSDGSVAIHDNGSITTNGIDGGRIGTVSQGIKAIATGDITIDGGGSVTTRGTRSAGVSALTYGGNISIDLGNISTSGASATGVSAEAIRYDYDAQTFVGAGNIDVTVNDISARGGGSYGVTAQGIDVDLHASGNITAGAGGVVVRADGQAAIAIDGNVTADRIGVYALAGGDLSIAVGGNTSSGHGITAVSYDGAVTVSTGDITAVSGGVYALAVSNGGDGTGRDVLVSTGNITTTGTGPGASGVIAVSDDFGANVAVKTGNISTRGDYAAGVYAQSNGNVSITTGDIATRGLGADGLIAEGYSVDVQAGNVVSQAGIGILAETASGSSGSLNVTAGDISTIYDNGIGVAAIADAGAVHVNVGSISTHGDGAAGIYARGKSAPIEISAANIATTGDGGVGVFAISQGDVSITVSGVVSTSGSTNANGLNASGIYAVSTGQNVTVNAGSVSTAGDLAYGILAYGDSAVVNASNVVTTGLNSRGIIAVSGSKTTITAGNVSTSGDYAVGIEGESQGAVAVSTTGKVATQGRHAYGIFAESTGTVSVSNSGTISTAGEQAHGIYAVGSDAQSVSVANTGGVAVAGDNADAIRLENAGSLSIVNSGSVSAGGTNGNGLSAIAFDLVTTPIDLTIRSDGKVSTSGANAVGILANIVDDPYNGARGAQTVSVTAASVSTSGAGSTGIWAHNEHGAVSVDAASVVAKGAGSTGIVALGGGDIAIQAGIVSATGDGIYAHGLGAGSITLGVTGSVSSSGGDGADLVSGGGATGVSVASGGGVSGAVDGVRIESGGGAVSIANAGTIAGGSGYAIDVTGLSQAARADARSLAAVPGVAIANSGTIAGAVSLGAGDDVLTNTGLFVATKDSDFGAGSDSFVNSGTFAVAKGAAPLSVTLLGLESFRNSGLVDLRNGVAGDTLTLPGGYVASGGARLGLDVGANGVSDKLVVTGIASGTTSIVLNATAANATLLAKPVTLVQAGKGTAADAFTIANQSLGFVSYGLGFDAATGSFQLTSQAGVAVHRLAKANEAAQAIWGQSAEAWSTHMAELRDLADPASRVWGQAYGKVDTRHEARDGAQLGYRQDYYGGQAGVDLAGKRTDDGHGFVLGVTGGYLSSKLNFRASASRVRFDTVNVGAYAGLRAGALFANILGQYDHYRADASDSQQAWSDRFNGSGYGAEAELGARLGSDAFFAEPVASIAWQRTSLDTLHALGQSLDFDHDTGLTGRLGGRIGGTFDVGGGSRAVFYARASYVHEFKGKGGVLFESGGTSEDVAGTRLGDHGQGAIGVNILSAGRVSGFIEGDGDVGSSYKGGGGRVGIRFRL